jgi:hypothetical protein
VAYRSAAQICRLSVPKANAWWEKATAE